MVFISCSTEINEPDIIKATLIQESSTKAIETEANKIVKTTKVPSVKNSAKIIIVENDKLKSNIDVLAGADKALIEKDKEIEEWKNKYNSRISAFVLILQMIGCVAIPVGLFLAFKISKGYFLLVGIGLSLVVSGMAINWILTHELLILGGLSLVALFTVFRMYYSQRKAVKSAVELVDKLKPHVKKETADKFLGHGGSIKNDPITKKIIDKYRKL